MVKIKNRYYVIRILGEDVEKIRKGAIFAEIMRLGTEMFGDFGFAVLKMSLSIRVQDEDIVVIRIAESGESHFSPILPCIQKFANQPVVLTTIFTGNSMRSCEKRLIRERRAELHSKLAANGDNPVESRKIQQNIRRICGKPARIFGEKLDFKKYD